MIVAAQAVAECAAQVGLFHEAIAGDVTQSPTLAVSIAGSESETRTEYCVSWGARLVLYVDERMRISPHSDEICIRMYLRLPGLENPDLATAWTQLPWPAGAEVDGGVFLEGLLVELHRHARKLAVQSVIEVANNTVAGAIVGGMIADVLPSSPAAAAPPPVPRTVILGDDA